MPPIHVPGSIMKINILAIAAHPDDAELSCGGTLITHQKRGFTTGVIDLTRGEMGTRGTPEQRAKESEDAAKILDLTVRENLEMADSFFANDIENQLKVVRVIRKYQPDVILANAVYDRHPDHGKAAELIEEACFKSGLKKIVTQDGDGNEQKVWRPKKVYHSIQSVSIQPDFFVDISEAQEQKMKAIKVYKTQFFDPNSQEPQTYISRPEFIHMIEARALEYGHRIGVKYAEGFTSYLPLGVKDLYHLL